MSVFDVGLCIPFLVFIALGIALLFYYGAKTHSGGAIPRTRAEVARMTSGKEDYIFSLDHGVLGKQASSLAEREGYTRTFWSPLAPTLSAKKIPLPPLPSWCFDLPPIDLDPACGPGKRIKLVLPYDKNTEYTMLRPYIRQIHELKIQVEDYRRMAKETRDILLSTKYTTDAFKLIQEVQRMSRPRGKVSTLVDTQQPPPSVEAQTTLNQDG